MVMLQNGVPRLFVDGGIEPSGEADLRARLDSLHVEDPLAQLGLAGLRGSVTGSMTLAGTRQRPNLQGTLRAALDMRGRRPARVDGEAHWTGGELNATLQFAQAAGHRLDARCRLPISLDLARPDGVPAVDVLAAPLSAELQARSFDFSWFEPLVPKRVARDLQGFLDGRVEIAGDPAHPSLSGSLELSRAGAELPKLGTKYRNGEARLAFAGRTIALERASVESGKGRMETAGRVHLEGPGRRRLDVQARWHRFLASNTLLAKVESSGNLSVSGPLVAPRIEGTVDLANTTLYVEGGERERKVEPIELSEDDLRELQERFGYGVQSLGRPPGAFADSLSGAVRLRIGENVWVRRRSDPVLALEMSGEVHASKEPHDSLRVVGQIGIQSGRSYMSFMGRRFELSRAQVVLPGPIAGAHAELEARYDPSQSGSTGSSRGASVTAVVTVDTSGARADLQSEPYMDRASLLNYLATGQTEGELESGSAYGLAVGSVLGAVGGAAGRSLGFQVVQVSQDAYGGQTLSAGNYVDPRLYLGFRQPVVQGQQSNRTTQGGTYSTEYEVEVEVLKQLLLNLQGGGSQYRFLLRPRLGR
jgi:autotransporter translocation and assembly factor TamB